MNLKNAHALLIGVGGDLPVTVTDASAIAEVLKDNDRAAYNPNNVVLLTESEATRKNVLTELDNIIQKVKNIEDATVIIYYSGHGGKYQGTDGEDFYLLTHGFDSYDRKNTMVSGNEFSERINSIRSKKLLVMLDCCHSAGIITDRPLIKLKSLDTKIISSNIEILKKLASGRGKVFITSCDDDEQSVILPNAKNSLFTEVILEALEGYASNNDEYVRMIDLLYHVLIQVPKRIKEYNRLQRPIINKIDSLSSDYFICKSSAQITIPKSTDISVPVRNEQLPSLIQQFNIDNSHKPIEITTNNESISDINVTKKIKILEGIEVLIGQGNTEKAISRFLAVTKDHFKDYSTESHVLANKYNTLINEKMISIIDDDTYRLELNKIAHALHFFVGKAKNNF